MGGDEAMKDGRTLTRLLGCASAIVLHVTNFICLELWCIHTIHDKETKSWRCQHPPKD